MTPTNKNLQDLFKTYVAKSDGEEKFRKAHVISTVDNNDEKLGPKDDQFVATTKTYERDSTHHGYDAGGDEKVYSEEALDEMSSKMKMKLGLYGKKKKMEEEVEELDETSKAKLGRYINAAKDSIDMTSYRSGIKDGTAISRNDPYTSKNPLEKKLSKRHKGIETAVKKLTREESEQIDELSVVGLDKYHSKAYQSMFDKDSDKKTVAKRKKGMDTAYNKAGFGKAKVYATEEAELDEATLNPEDERHFEKQTPKMQAAINLHLRKGMDYEDAVAAARRVFSEEVEQTDKLSTAIKKKLSDEGGAAAFKPLKDTAMKMGINLTPEMLKNIPGVSQHDDGDYILDESALNELSKSTLGSYVKKAKNQLSSSDYHVGRAVGAREAGQSANFSKELENKLAARGKKRYHGIDKAVGKMTKEEVEELDEKKLTKAELEKREEVATAIERDNPGMDMGKKMAIATAQAKKVAEEIELGEAVNSDDAFDRLEKAGAKDVKTTSGGIRYTHGGKEYNLRHNMKRTGHRTVRTAELEQHLNRLQEENEVVEEQFAPGKFKEAMIQRGLAALQEHIVGNK